MPVCAARFLSAPAGSVRALEAARQYSGDEGPETRETGADDADVGFDRGPGRGGGVVVGWVFGVGDGD